MILVAFLITIFVVVGVHELGHFWAAKSVGVRATNFAIGFGPELVGWTSKTGLRWSFKMLPIGGYVRFVGDENAASLSRSEEGPVVPGSLRSVSPLKRAWVISAGPGINLVLTVLLFATYALIDGKPTSVVASRHPYLSTVEGSLSEPLRDSVESNSLRSASSHAEQPLGASESLISRAKSTLVVGSVVPGSPAARSGIEAGDVILKLGTNSVPNWTYLRARLPEADQTNLVIWRDGQELVLDLNMNGSDTLGVRGVSAIEFERRSVHVPEALMFGASRVSLLVSRTATGIWGTLTHGIGDCDLHGPVRIAQLSSQTLGQGPTVFLQFLAVISASLGLFNLLPIPGLDGGHLASLAVQSITGKPASEFVTKAMFILGVGLIVYLLLMAVLSDILC